MPLTEKQQAIVAQTDWPRREDDATADALIKYFARIALSMTPNHDRISSEYFNAKRGTPEQKRALLLYLDSLTSIISMQQVPVLLAEAQKRDAAQADDLARTLWGYTEEGGLLHELMWDYLTDRGVDPEAVLTAAQEAGE